METILYAFGWFCIVTGGFFGVTGAIGMFRFPDFYTRIHAVSITDTLCAGLIVLGLLLQSDSGLMVIKLLLVLFILAYTGPTAIHALAKTARQEKLDPVLDHEEEAS